MTAREMMPAVGQVVLIATTLGELQVAVLVKDVKMAWGSARLLVTPIVGTGEVWVDLSRVRQAARGAQTAEEMVSAAVDDGSLVRTAAGWEFGGAR